MSGEWGVAIPSVLIAVSTWYTRRAQSKDTTKVIASTAAQSTSNEIKSGVDTIEIRLQILERDLALVKGATVKDTGVDHRGPSGGAKQ